MGLRESRRGQRTGSVAPPAHGAGEGGGALGRHPRSGVVVRGRHAGRGRQPLHVGGRGVRPWRDPPGPAARHRGGCRGVGRRRSTGSQPQSARLQVVHGELGTRGRRTHRPWLVPQRVQMHAGIPAHESTRELGPPPVQQALQNRRVRHGARHIRTPQAPPSQSAQRGASLSTRPSEAREDPRRHRHRRILRMHPRLNRRKRPVHGVRPGKSELAAGADQVAHLDFRTLPKRRRSRTHEHIRPDRFPCGQ
eukprot:gene13430-biopygen493